MATKRPTPLPPGKCRCHDPKCVMVKTCRRFTENGEKDMAVSHTHTLRSSEAPEWCHHYIAPKKITDETVNCLELETP